MAKWIVIREGLGKDKLIVFYRNLIKQSEFECGRISSDWSDHDVLCWIFNHAETLTVGDIFQLSDGKVLQYDGRIFSPDNGWSRMRKDKAEA